MEHEGLRPEQMDIPLGQVSTIWTMVLCAHGGPLLSEADAQRRFMERYHGAVYRYFFTALRDPDAAQELFQQFAERFVRGDFKNFDPRKGRFRDYVRVALINMIRDYRRRQASRQHVDIDNIVVADNTANRQVESLDAEFINSWRDELLNRTWEALRQEQRRGGVPFHVVLERSVQNPGLTSAELATELNTDLAPEKPLSDALVRKTLQLAREQFADLLVEEVACSLGDHTVEQLEQELIDLELIGYCRDALDLRWIVGS